MPKVGNKKFAYTAAGKKKAASYAKKTGQSIKTTGSYKGKSNKLGGGGRFAQMTEKLKGKVSNPKAVAASIGRKKYGAKKMASMAAAGRKRSKK